MNGQEPILRVAGLQTAYGARQVLKGIDCAVSDRTVTVVLGPSGCGKTTLLKALNRTLELVPEARVTGGAVRFKGGDMYTAGCDAQLIRKQIGLIHQRPVTFPMSIMENVLFGVRFHGHWAGRNAEDATREHLEEAGLWEETKDRLHEPAANLSGGQQQRLCIARTLANRPDLILMDEPCSSLDPRATRVIEDLIGRLRQRMAILVVTHNLAQARRIGQEALALVDGRIAEAGVAERVLGNPQNESVRDFLQMS